MFGWLMLAIHKIWTSTKVLPNGNPISIWVVSSTANLVVTQFVHINVNKVPFPFHFLKDTYTMTKSNWSKRNLEDVMNIFRLNDFIAESKSNSWGWGRIKRQGEQNRPLSLQPFQRKNVPREGKLLYWRKHCLQPTWLWVWQD